MRMSRHRVPCGAIAQLGERLNGIQEVRGSTPLGSTIFTLVTMNVRGLVASGLPRAGLRISHHSTVPLPAFAQLVD
jgi:hypothetical protein